MTDHEWDWQSLFRIRGLILCWLRLVTAKFVAHGAHAIKHRLSALSNVIHPSSSLQVLCAEVNQLAGAGLRTATGQLLKEAQALDKSLERTGRRNLAIRACCFCYHKQKFTVSAKHSWCVQE